ncbi:hypothetical protein acdb102_49410 [Acidothermaceae bacterium B102]|nr:hypothetical protein acdb102_49410 [Acidothermaceae bacterium B102]
MTGRRRSDHDSRDARCTTAVRSRSTASWRSPVRDGSSSPSDFPEEHYERSWPDRFPVDQLNDTGKKPLGLA